MGNVAFNPETGKAVRLDGNNWVDTPVAKNDKTGEIVAFDGERWAKIDAPKAAPKAQDLSGASHALSFGTREALSGLASIPGMAYDAARVPINLGVKAFNAVTGKQIPMVERFGTQLGGILDNAGLDRPQTAQERLLGSIVEGGAAAIPTLGVGLLARGVGTAPRLVQALSDAPVSQIVSNITGNASGEVARENGAGPVTQFGASLLGGLSGAVATSAAAAGGRLAAAAAQPFSQAGREAMAADALLMSSADPNNLARRIGQGMVDPNRRLPGSPVTTAQAAQDSGLAILEAGLRNDPTRLPGQGGASAAVAIRDMEAGRNAARTNAINALNPIPNATDTTLGAATRNSVEAANDAMSGRVRAAYDAIDPAGVTQIPASSFAQGIEREISRFYGNGGGEIPFALQSVIADLSSATTVPIQFLQRINTRLGNIAGMANQSGDGTLAGAAGAARGLIDDYMTRYANHQIGMSPSDATALNSAVSLRRQQGLMFNRDESGASATGRMLATDRYGSPMIQDNAVANMALSSPENLSQVLRASPQSAPFLKSQFISNLLDRATTTNATLDSAGNSARTIGNAAFTKFIQDNAEIINRLFNAGERRRLQQITADFAETNATASAGRANGSPTAQNLSVANLISRATNGLIDPSNPLAQTVAGLGPIMKLIYSAPEAATRELINQAVIDPNMAMRLLARATPQNVQRAADYLNRTLPERISRAIIDAGTRAGSRQATLTGLQAQQPE